MKKTVIRRDESQVTGYVLIDIDDEGVETKKPIEWSRLPGNVEFKLPENFANRHWYKVSGLKGRDEVVLEYKPTRTLGHRDTTGKSESKSVKVSKLSEDDMLALCKSDTEKKLIASIFQRAKHNAEVNELQSKIEALEKMKAELEKQKAELEAKKITSKK